VNPRAAGGKSAKRWPRVAKRLGDVTTHFTESSGHATVLARELLEQGFELIIAAGGDGTTNEVANGFFRDDLPIRPTACLGVVPLGTGGDFQRTLGISTPEQAIKVLTNGVALPMDVGKAVFRAHDGSTQSRYFVNLVSFGMGGEVAARAKNFLMPLGGTVAFLYATLVVFLSYRAKQVALRLDDAGQLGFSITNVAVGNGRYHGGGMHVCPKAVLDDGLFEVTVIDRLGMLELLRDLPVLYSDDIYVHPKTHHFRAWKVTAEAAEPTRIEIDGEPLGTLPLEVTMLPRALRVMVPVEQAIPRGV
jgi:YegS/Rv2252/BmrU family lipid kinase